MEFNNKSHLYIKQHKQTTKLKFNGENLNQKTRKTTKTVLN